MWHQDARPLSGFLSPADFQLSRSLLALAGKGLKLPCSLLWEHPCSPSGAAEVCWYVCNAAPAGREHPALAETFPARPPLPSSPELRDGAEEQSRGLWEMWKRVKWQSSLCLGFTALLTQSVLAQGSIAGHVLVLA